MSKAKKFGGWTEKLLRSSTATLGSDPRDFPTNLLPESIELPLLAFDERLNWRSRRRKLWHSIEVCGPWVQFFRSTLLLSTDTMLPKYVRREVLLLALLFSSLGLVGQSAESSSPSSDNPLAGQTQYATPSAPATGGARNQCGFSTPETQGKVSPGKLSGGKLIHSVRPEHPPAARKAHIQGTVVLCATIAKDGKLRNVRAFSGPEELIPSAIKAVEQWRYQPYLKNNEPVDVDSEIHLGFKLSP
jgi:TonB family protein